MTRAGRAGLWVGGREHQARDPRQRDRSGAHRARLEGDVDGRVREAPSAQRRRRLAQRQQLRVGGRVGSQLPLVAALAQDLLPPRHHRPDRNVAMACGALGEPEGPAHEHFVGVAETVRGHEREYGRTGARVKSSG